MLATRNHSSVFTETSEKSWGIAAEEVTRFTFMHVCISLKKISLTSTERTFSLLIRVGNGRFGEHRDVLSFHLDELNNIVKLVMLRYY